LSNARGYYNRVKFRVSVSFLLRKFFVAYIVYSLLKSMLGGVNLLTLSQFKMLSSLFKLLWKNIFLNSLASVVLPFINTYTSEIVLCSAEHY
jgi:uncharacterized protein YqhQ